MTAKYVKGHPLPPKPPLPVFILHPSAGKTSLAANFGSFLGSSKAYPIPAPPNNHHWMSVPHDPDFWNSLHFGHTEQFSRWDSDNSWYRLNDEWSGEGHRILIPKKARKKLIRMIVTEGFFVSLERSGIPYDSSAYHPITVHGVEQKLWLFASNSHSKTRTLTEAVQAAVKIRISESIITLPEGDLLNIYSQLNGAAPGRHYSTLTEYNADALPWIKESDTNKWELYLANMDGRRATCFLSIKKGVKA